MVSKITLFEPHFDGAQFGSSSLERDSAGGSVEPDVEASTGGESRSRPSVRVLALLGAITAGLLVGRAALRRRDRTDPEPVEVEEQLIDEIPAE